MIDCSRTENFIKEKERLCQYYKDTGCTFCILNRNMSCDDFIVQCPQKAIEIVQKWSDKHPQKTLLTEFLEHYPNVEMSSDGFPDYILPCILGLVEKKDICKNRCFYFYDKDKRCRPCYDCWNTLVEESEETE